MEQTRVYEEKAPAAAGSNDLDSETIDDGSIAAPRTHLKRHLGNRQVQLIAIGGSIGTALFVSIGRGLEAGGAGSLLLAFIIFSCALGLVNNGMAEMAVYMPSEGGFIRMAGRWVDESFGFMAGWNFFLYEALLIPWEISALNLVLTYWSDNIPIGAVCAACIVSYAALNIFAVKYYGEAEFWLASGKVLLIAIVFMFTFVTMVGGNPQHHAYGFSNFGNPSAFLEKHSTGSLGQFEGFLAALWIAAFTIVGPEYLSMVAGETKRPRTYLKSAFKTMYWRFGVFFIGGALCVGIVLRADDPTLSSILDGSSGGSGTAAASPYVIAMANMKITVLPHITNALLVSSIYSAGNALTYCAVRSLHGLALAGQAPAILKKCTKSGVPIYCYFVTMLFPLLSFLQISAGSAQVITWFANLVTAGQIINYIVMCVTYIFFHRAMMAQGLDRGTLPYRGYFQPYCAYIGLAAMILVVTCYGYTVLLPGNWDVGSFFSYYTMLFLAPLTYGGWKIVKRTKFIPSLEADLVWDKPMIDQYEMETAAEASRGFWRDVRQMVSFRKRSA